MNVHISFRRLSLNLSFLLSHFTRLGPLSSSQLVPIVAQFRAFADKIKKKVTEYSKGGPAFLPTSLYESSNLKKAKDLLQQRDQAKLISDAVARLSKRNATQALGSSGTGSDSNKRQATSTESTVSTYATPSDFPIATCAGTSNTSVLPFLCHVSQAGDILVDLPPGEMMPLPDISDKSEQPCAAYYRDGARCRRKKCSYSHKSIDKLSAKSKEEWCQFVLGNDTVKFNPKRVKSMDTKLTAAMRTMQDDGDDEPPE